MSPKRTTHSQLPSPEEMQRIASAESQRPLPANKVGVHYVDFATIRALCRHVGISAELFDIDNRTSAQILQAGSELLDELVERIRPDVSTLPLLEAAYNYLAQQDKPQPSDIMFVFGGKSTARIERAVELFGQGLAKRLVVSGRGPIYTDAGLPEARRYQRFALDHGVPQDSLVVEDQSVTMVDNIRRSLDMLERQNIEFRSIIIINSPYAQRRGWCMWRKYLPDDCSIYRVNARPAAPYSPDRWFASPDGLRTVLGEFIKMRNAITFDSV